MGTCWGSHGSTPKVYFGVPSAQNFADHALQIHWLVMSQRNMISFWKPWTSKIEQTNIPSQIDGFLDKL